MAVSVEHRPEGVVVALAGELDRTNADAIERRIAEAVRPAARLVVDLSGLRHLDSSGLALLDRLARRHRAAGIRFVVPERALYRRVLEIVHFTETLPLAPSVEEALASLGGE